MNKYFIILVLSLLSIVSRGAVGDRIYKNSIYYTITKEVKVYSSTSYSMGEVMLGIKNGNQVITLKGPVTIPMYVSDNKYEYKVVSIGSMAFYEATGITSISLPNTVTSIGASAFNRCTSLEEITLPANITSIKAGTFSSCTSLRKISVENFSSIGESAFKGCSNLENLVFSRKVDIGSNAFENCSSLSKLTFEADGSVIGSNAFSGCTNLKEVYSYLSNLNCVNSTSFSGIPANVTLYVPNGMKGSYESNSIWSQAFPKIVAIPPAEGTTFSVNIPVGDGFENMTFEVIDSIKMLAELKSLSGGVISDKAQNVKLSIPSLVQNGDFPFHVVGIGSEVFKNTKLESIYLPKSIEYINDGAFSGCTSLMEVNASWHKPESVRMGTDCFNGISNNTVLVVPPGTKELYASITPWSFFTKIEETSPIYLADVTTYYGSQVEIPLCLRNTEKIAGLQFKLRIPHVASIAVNDGGELSVSTTNRTEGMTIMGRKDPDEENCYLFVVFSLDGNAINGAEGAVMNVRLNIAQDIESGTHDIKIEDVYMTTNAFETLNPAASTSELAIKDYLLGDVNGDGNITAKDASLVLQLVAKKVTSETEGVTYGAADVNGDGQVTAKDASMILQYIAKKISW